MLEFDSKYHYWLKKVLNEFSNENKDKLSRDKHSLKLISSKQHCRSLIEYQPDYCFKFKTGKKSSEYIIFEFLDSQSFEGIIADIVECACIKNCRLLLFLSKDAEKHKQSENVTNVICDFLDEINGENLLEVVNLHIPQRMGKEAVKNEIYNEINKRIKLPKQKFILGKSGLSGRAVLG